MKHANIQIHIVEAELANQSSDILIAGFQSYDSNVVSRQMEIDRGLGLFGLKMIVLEPQALRRCLAAALPRHCERGAGDGYTTLDRHLANAKLQLFSPATPSR